MLESKLTGKDELRWRIYKSAGTKLCTAFLVGDRVTFIGEENIIKDQRHIITVNHPGVGKDIASILKLYFKHDQELYFVLRHELVQKTGFIKRGGVVELLDEYVKKQFSKFGPALPWLINALHTPLSVPFAQYLERKVTMTEMISVNISTERNGNGNINRKAIKSMKEYVMDGRNLVVMQHNPEKIQSVYHDYLYRFQNLPALLALNIYQNTGIDVPVLPIVIHGAEGLMPGRDITVIVEKPVYASEYAKEAVAKESMMSHIERVSAQALEREGFNSRYPAQLQSHSCLRLS